MKNNKGGRPSKYKDIEKQLDKIKLLYEKGFTDIEVSKIIGICEKTLNNYKNEYPEFLQSIKESKQIADDKVKDSLFKRANGFEYVETHIEGIDSGKDENGNQIISNRKIKQIKKTVLPDPTSMIFWLCNRDKENWQQRQNFTHDLDNTLTDLIKKVNGNLSGAKDSKKDS